VGLCGFSRKEKDMKKSRYTIFVESDKLDLLREVFSREYGDLPLAVRCALDAVLDAVAADPECPGELGEKIRMALANGDDNRPPKENWPEQKAPVVKKCPRFRCKECGYVFAYIGEGHDYQDCDCPVGQVLNVDFNEGDIRGLRIMGNFDNLERLPD